MSSSAPPSTTSTTIQAVIFDMDGLLLDTETIYTIAQDKICQQYGRKFTWDLKAKMMGQKAIEAAKIFIDDLHLHGQLTPEDFLIQREQILDELFPEAALLPGAERLLRYLHKNNIPFCLATSSHKRHYDLKTSKHTELFSLFNHVVTGCQVSKGKPDPEIFLTAFKQWNNGDSDVCTSVDRVLVFEDAPSGVAAAKAAGMKCVMVPDANLDASYHGDADKVLKSLEEFDPQKYGLPPFDD